MANPLESPLVPAWKQLKNMASLSFWGLMRLNYKAYDPWQEVTLHLLFTVKSQTLQKLSCDERALSTACYPFPFPSESLVYHSLVRKGRELAKLGFLNIDIKHSKSPMMLWRDYVEHSNITVNFESDQKTASILYHRSFCSAADTFHWILPWQISFPHLEPFLSLPFPSFDTSPSHLPKSAPMFLPLSVLFSMQSRI